jgi:hypothetical protein
MKTIPAQPDNSISLLYFRTPLFSKIYLSLVLIILLTASCTDTSVYVSPTGNDNRKGTKQEPVATLQRAVELTRGRESKKIVVGEGNYYNVSVKIANADSGLQIAGQSGKEVKLYGGIPLRGWQQAGQWLEAEIPEDVSLDFRILAINDTLRNRARLPEKGAFNHRNEWPHQWQSSQGGWSQTPTEDDLTTLYYNPDDLGPWLNASNAELTVFHAWDDSYAGVAAIDTVNNSLTFSNKTTHPPGAYASWAGEKTRQYIVWNIREGMTRPGQWYLDRPNRKIVYWPLPHESADELTAVIPVQTHLIHIENGTSGITVENLLLSGSGAPLLNPGYGTYAVTGAVVADKVENLVLRKLQIKNVAGWAVKITGNNIVVENCEFSFTGGGGLSYSGKNIKISRCGLHDMGKLYFGAVGIMGGGENNRVAGCELYNLPYCAINGLGKKSIAENNLIYNFKQMMVDGGAIYCYGGDSTIYRNNAVLASRGNSTEGWSYYFDELSENCIMENNLAVNTIVPMHHHMANGITIRNNLFIDEGHQKISFPLSSNLNFIGNTFAASDILFSGPNGEKGDVAKESLNPVFQKYFNCNGITGFSNNRLYADAVRQDVLHIYNNLKNQEFEEGKQAGNLTEAKTIELEIPEYFKQTGYRNNFEQVYNSLMDKQN